MCGIVGAVAQRDVEPILLEGLKRLEYRGYDSSGIAILNENHQIKRQRAVGKVKELAHLLEKSPLSGKIGIGHTRWATHGKPSEINAHPFLLNDRLAIVHNGIIENYDTYRRFLCEQNYQFESETDTEVVGHFLYDLLKRHDNQMLVCLGEIVQKLEGSYALAILDQEKPHQLWVVRSGCPLLIGLGIGENFIASDHLALLPVTQKFIYLEEGDIACIEKNKIIIYDAQQKTVSRKIHEINTVHDAADRGKYRHYMLKEIFEQPEAVSNSLEGRLGHDNVSSEIFGSNAAEIFSQVKQIQIAACGTSYHAGMIARYWFEEIAGIPCQIEVASELRYRKNVVQNNTLFISLSQSGETADTLSAQRAAKMQGYLATLAICNVNGSSLIRTADLSLIMQAGPEIGVASTKAFTSQLTCLLLLTLVLLKFQTDHKPDIQHTLIQQLKKLPHYITAMLNLNQQIHELARGFEHKHHALFIGRGVHYPVALEGALKLKELSYIHAEGYPAGELKHGPLALLDKEMPVIILAPNNELIDKLKSNIQEIQSRGALTIILTDKNTHIEKTENNFILELPITDRIISPILYTIPLQLLSYHVAVLKGTDVDQPRNLAKSVTVE